MFSFKKLISNLRLGTSLFFIASSAQSIAAEPVLPAKHIAIVRDDTSAVFDSVIAGFEKELGELAEGRYDYKLIDQFNAQGEAEDVEAQLLKAIRDPKIDIIYAAGIISSIQAERLPEILRTKPIVAGAVEFSDFDSDSISADGSSAIPNYTFILEARRVPADLLQLKELSGETTLYTFIDQTVMRSESEQMNQRVASMEKKVSADIRIIAATTRAESSLAKLPSNAKAVYVPLLPSLAAGEREKLFAGLTSRGILSFSMFGITDVKKGALAGLSLDNKQAFFRRTALNIHQILSGITTDLLPVVLTSNDQLRINMETAKRISWSPDYDTLLTADLINIEAIRKADGSLSMEEAMSLASKQNADVRAAKERLLASFWETESARTAKRPQLSVNGQAGYSGFAERISRRGQRANTYAGSLGAEVSQLLYSDRVTSAIRAQEEVEEATRYDVESVQLDSMQAAANAYINVLRSEALYEIEKENVALITQNLNLAKTRSDIGATEASEVFRWQSALAQGKAQLIQRDTNRKNARVALNVSIGKPRSAYYSLTDIKLQDDDFYFMGKSLEPLLQDLDDFEKYGQFIKKLAAWRSPEIRAFEKNLRAQGILLDERSRRNFRPEIALTASATAALTETANDYDTQGEWAVGIGFQIPLFEGGLRKTETERIKAVIGQLTAQRDNALYLIEQSALSSVYNTAASHPGLRLNRRSLEASVKNYDSIKTKYSQGSASVVDLLDAQSQLIGQRQALAGSNYQYLQDIIGVQRSTAWFEFTKTPEEKEKWRSMLANYLQTGSLHISHN